MKRILAVILIVGLVLCLSAVTALAEDPAYNFNVSGTVQVSESGVVSGTLSDDPDAPVKSLTILGTMTGYVDHRATFTGTVSGYMTGGISAAINDNGIDTLSGEITLEDDTHYWITGIFPKSGVAGQFIGRVSTATAAIPVEDITLGTASGETSVDVGATLQMTAGVAPEGASGDVAWSVWTADGSEVAAIDADTGLLTGKQAGTVTVIAKALDGSLKDATMTVTVVAAAPEEPSVDPTYTIVIPTTIDFGSLQKNTGAEERPFVIEAKDVQIDDGGEIQVRVNSTFKMVYKSEYLEYSLHNHRGVVGNGGQFALFTGNAKEEGYIGINTADITHSGNYTGIMTFMITYEIR